MTSDLDPLPFPVAYQPYFATSNLAPSRTRNECECLPGARNISGLTKHNSTQATGAK